MDNRKQPNVLYSGEWLEVRKHHLQFPVTKMDNATDMMDELLVHPTGASLEVLLRGLGLLDVQGICTQHLTLQSIHSPLGFFIIPHLYHPFTIASASNGLDKNLCVIHPAKLVKKPLKIKLVKMAREA